MQKSHPFGLAENRFTWVKMYCNGNDLKNHKKLFNIRKDNLEGGIGHYFQKIKLENDKELEVEKNLLKDNLNHKKQKKMKYRFQNLSSQRVINPEKDTEVEKISKKSNDLKGINDQNKILKNNLDIETQKNVNALIKEKDNQIYKYKEEIRIKREKEKERFALLINKYDKTLIWQEKEDIRNGSFKKSIN